MGVGIPTRVRTVTYLVSGSGREGPVSLTGSRGSPRRVSAKGRKELGFHLPSWEERPMFHHFYPEFRRPGVGTEVNSELLP